MAENARGFVDLVEESPQRLVWRQQREDAILFVRSLGDTRIFEAIAKKLSEELSNNGKLSSRERLLEVLVNVSSGFGLPEDNELVNKYTVQTIAISGALALLLEQGEPSFDRLSDVASAEAFLDVSFVAERIAGSDASGAWRVLLQKVQLSVTSINDDEYQAKDELERWGKELGRPVPSWREGDFPHRGIATVRLLSGILRVLDEEAWLAFLDRLPVPSMMEALLWDAGIDAAPARLLDWLRRAPVAFDDDGKRTTGALVFILERRALGLIEADLMRRCTWGDEERTGRESLLEGAGARQELVAVVKGRADGDDLVAELSARYMTMAQASQPDSQRTKLRHDLYSNLGLEYAKALGDAETALDRLRRRETADRRGSRWGLWLAACARVAEPKTDSELGAHSEELRACWTWLQGILADNDAGIVERYGPFAQWTERLAGIALASSKEPLASLEGAWKALAGQRLTPQENRYSKDAWATSRFLIRAAYFACHGRDDAQEAAKIWRAGMDMALSAWLSGSNPDPFAEVVHGLGHLAQGKRGVDGEPRRTFEYLVGLHEEVSRAIIVLLENGTVPADVISAAAQAGVDARTYLALNQDERMKDPIEKARAKLGFGTSSRATDEAGGTT